MRFLSRAIKANSEQEKADYLLFDLSPQYARKLIAQREASVRFLAEQHGEEWAKYLCEVRLAWQGLLVGFDLLVDDPLSDELAALFERLEDDLAVVPAPDGFEPPEDRCTRLDGQRVMFEHDGEMSLTCYDHYTGDDLSTERFALDVLELVSASVPTLCTTD